jgi:hypothetical protein
MVVAALIGYGGARSLLDENVAEVIMLNYFLYTDARLCWTSCSNSSSVPLRV